MVGIACDDAEVISPMPAEPRADKRRCMEALDLLTGSRLNPHATNVRFALHAINIGRSRGVAPSKL